jgi:hypothetical protein
MPAGLGGYIPMMFQNDAVTPVTSTATLMGFGSGSRYRTPATTASRGLTVSPPMQQLKKHRRMK